MKNLITREQVIAECATFNTNFDLSYIRDTHIQAAGWQWIRNAFGTAMYADFEAKARTYKTWVSGADYASGDYVVHKYNDGYENLKVGFYVNLTGGNNGEPQDTTGDFSTATFFDFLSGSPSECYCDLYANGMEKALAWATMAEALYNLQYKSGGHGIMTDTPEFEEAAPVKRQMEQCHKYVEMYLDEAHQYICNNASDFPLYSPEWSNSKSHSSGLVFYDSAKQGAVAYGLTGWKDYFNDMWALRYPL